VTSTTATETETAALFDVDAGDYHDHDQRPTRYLLVTREFRDYEYGDEYDDDYTVDDDYYDYTYKGYDDLGHARADTLRFEESGIFDNWDGQWIDEPDFADQLYMFAEGSAPYAARPIDDPWRAAMAPIIATCPTCQPSGGELPDREDGGYREGSRIHQAVQTSDKETNKR